MRSLRKYSLKLIVITFVALFAGSASGQYGRLNLESLNGLEARARDVVEVNIDGKLLDLAKRVSIKIDDEKARKAGLAIQGLKGIYVRVFRFANENEYSQTDVDAIRGQLAPPWERLADVRSKRNNQKVDVYTMFTGETMNGVAVVISDSKSIAVVNIVGPIDIEMLVELGGKLNIPDIDIEREIRDIKPKE